MPYKVFVKVGRKYPSTMGSIPLPNRKRVYNYIKVNPLVRSNTKINVTNLRTGKVTTGTQGRFLPSRRY